MIYRRGWVPVLYRFELERRLRDQGFENWREICRFLCDGDANTWEDANDPSRYAYQVVDNTKWRGRVGFESTSKLGLLCKQITGLE